MEEIKLNNILTDFRKKQIGLSYVMDRVEHISDDLLRKVAVEARYKLKHKSVTYEQFEELALRWLEFRDYFMVSKYFTAQLNLTLSERDCRNMRLDMRNSIEVSAAETQKMNKDDMTYLDQMIGSPTNARRLHSFLSNESTPKKKPVVKSKKDNFLSAQLMGNFNHF
jgi:hypothetical protein